MYYSVSGPSLLIVYQLYDTNIYGYSKFAIRFSYIQGLLRLALNCIIQWQIYM